MNHGGGVSGCSTPETPRVQGSSSAGLEGDPKNCISSRFLRGANAHGLGPRSDHGFYIPDYLQSFLHRLQCWLSGCDELIRQQQDKTKFSPPCYSCILINICFLLGSLEKKKKSFDVYICNPHWNELDAKVHSVAKHFLCGDKRFPSFL